MIFIIASAGHFTPGTIALAAQHGVPMANLLVPISGLIALTGGLSVLFGYRARIGGATVTRMPSCTPAGTRRPFAS